MAINESLAHVSNNLVYSAIAVYTAAMLGYAAEWAFGSRSRVGRQALAIGADAEAEGSGSASLGSARVRTAAVGADGEGSGGGVALATRPAVGGGSANGRGGAEDESTVVAGESVRADMFGRMAVALTLLAFALHLGGVVCRAVAADRVPWANMYEFSISSALAVAFAYLVLLAKFKARWMGLFVSGLVVLTLGLAVTVLYTDAENLVPALHSYWIAIHVTAALTSGGAFAIGGVASVLFLVRDAHERRLAAGKGPGTLAGIAERLPSSATLDRTAYRTNALVFPLWTFAIIAGAIWAQSAWGKYWSWDPKETWAFITWVIYAAYLHARATAGWKGRSAAIIGIVGFVSFVFNYFIINMFVTGMHSYAGV